MTPWMCEKDNEAITLWGCGPFLVAFRKQAGTAAFIYGQRGPNGNFVIQGCRETFEQAATAARAIQQ